MGIGALRLDLGLTVLFIKFEIALEILEVRLGLVDVSFLVTTGCLLITAGFVAFSGFVLTF